MGPSPLSRRLGRPARAQRQHEGGDRGCAHPPNPKVRLRHLVQAPCTGWCAELSWGSGAGVVRVRARGVSGAERSGQNAVCSPRLYTAQCRFLPPFFLFFILFIVRDVFFFFSLPRSDSGCLRRPTPHSIYTIWLCLTGLVCAVRSVSQLQPMVRGMWAQLKPEVLAVECERSAYTALDSLIHALWPAPRSPVCGRPSLMLSSAVSR